MCYIKVISLATLILIFSTFKAFSSIILPDDVNNEPLGQCMQRILAASLPCGITTSMIGKDKDISYFMRSIKRAKQHSVCSSFLMRTYHRFNTAMASDAYIIIVDDFLEFEQGMHNISTGTFWNPANKIIINHPNLMSITTLWDLFNVALKFRIFNVVFVGYVDEDFAIYTYHPFANQNCGRKFDSIVKISECSNSTNYTDMFPKINKSDLRNCTLRVAIIEDVPNVIVKHNHGKKALLGVEQNMLEIAAKEQGMRVEYILETNYYGFVLENRSVTGLLGLIQEGKADFAAGGMILTYNRAEVFNFLHGPKLSKYVLYSHAFLIPKWKNLYREFAGTLWIFTAFVSVFLITIMLGYKHFRSGRKQFDVISYALMFYGYCFSNPSSILNRDRSLRIFLGFWIVFTLYMSSFYLSKFLSLVLTENQRTKEDILASDLVNNPNRIPCVSNVTMDFFAHMFDNVSPSSNRTRLPECESSDTVLEAVAANEKYYTYELDHIYEMKECSFLDEHGKSKIAQWMTNTYNVYLSIYYYKGFPLKERFQYLAQRIFEVGIISKKAADIKNVMNIGCGKRTKNFHIYTMGDMRLAFYVLIVGVLISSLTFLYEIYSTKKKATLMYKRP